MKRRDFFKQVVSTVVVVVTGFKVEPKFELPSYEGMVPKGITDMEFSTGFSAARAAYEFSWDNPNSNPIQAIAEDIKLNPGEKAYTGRVIYV